MSDAQSNAEADPAKHGLVARLIGDERRWRQDKARVRRLSPSYRTAAEGVERYVMHFGPGDGDPRPRCTRTSPICSSRRQPTAPRSARSSATTRWSSSRR